MLTKKNYKAIADIIKEHEYLGFDYYDLGNLISDLASYFKVDNPNFDRKKFLDACGFGCDE